MEQIIVYVIPFFLLLIGAELVYGRRRGKNTYRLNDALSSLSQGLISQWVGLVTQLFQIGFYTLSYRFMAVGPHVRFWHSLPGWICAIILFDFFDYWLHRMGHESAVMWAAHAVHHQSQDFNFSTALRQESTVAFIGWIFYLPMAILGVPPAQFAIAGLIVLIYQFWIHTEHIGKLGWFDRVFSSPSNHRVHHAVNDAYVDKNYGGMLVIWDRLFGTFTEEKEPCVFGTRSPLQSWDPVWAVVSGYWQLARTSARLPRWQDKLRVWFKPPGWLPEGMTAQGASFDLASARRRYDPALPPAAGVKAILQFCFLLAATAACLWYADDLSYWRLLTVSAALLAAVWALGAFLEQRMTAVRMLAVDVFAVVVALWVLMF